MAEDRDPRLAVLHQRPPVDDRDHSRHRPRLSKVEPADSRMRVRTAKENDVREARQTQIVRVNAAALQQAFRVRSRNAGADVRAFFIRIHGCAFARVNSTDSIASTMAW